MLNAQFVRLKLWFTLWARVALEKEEQTVNLEKLLFRKLFGSPVLVKAPVFVRQVEVHRPFQHDEILVDYEPEKPKFYQIPTF